MSSLVVPVDARAGLLCDGDRSLAPSQRRILSPTSIPPLANPSPWLSLKSDIDGWLTILDTKIDDSCSENPEVQLLARPNKTPVLRMLSISTPPAILNGVSSLTLFGASRGHNDNAVREPESYESVFLVRCAHQLSFRLACTGGFIAPSAGNRCICKVRQPANSFMPINRLVPRSPMTSAMPPHSCAVTRRRP